MSFVFLTCSSSEDNNKHLYKLSNCSSIQQTRRFGKTGGSLAIFVYDSLAHSVRKELSTNSEDIEALFVKIINAEIKSILVNTRYR